MGKDDTPSDPASRESQQPGSTPTHDTTRAKLEWLRELRDAGGARRSEQAVARQRERGQAARARAGGEAARPRLVRRARPLRPPPRGRVRDAREPALGRCRRHRVRDDLRPQGVRLLAGLHRLRRLPVRGVRGEGLQGDGHGRRVRLPGDRHQRLGWGADPGGRRLAGRVRGDLLAKRPGVGRDPADLAGHGPVRGRRGLLAGDHRLHPDGRGLLVHVHHRPRRGEDGHGRGRRRRSSAAPPRTPRSRVSPTSRRPDEESCLEDARYLLSFLPQNNLESAAYAAPTRPGRPRGRRRSTRSSPTARTSRTT